MFFFKARKRRRLREQPFPAEWAAIISRRVPAYRRLSPADRDELHGHIGVFLDEKRFEGCAGLEITDEIRLTIAAQACMLLLHRDTDYYPRLDTILVYPHRYLVKQVRQGPGGVVTEEYAMRLGESWQGAAAPHSGGPVVLSWDDVLGGAADAADGANVVYHEFAHQLDAESGAVEGAPALEGHGAYAAWARILGAEFNDLRRDLSLHRPTILSNYAATSPAEFFAVATEVFFERPDALRARHPALYRQLADYFRQDPAAAADN
ncbi:MAG: zinc-dependent peptidase [Phycisphaeraceae bacterium]|nr:zinc-dependent peptidase [Phycisphaeraceae bacterium]